MKQSLKAFFVCLILAFSLAGTALATAVTQELVGQSWVGTVSSGNPNETITLTNTGSLITTVVNNLNNNPATDGPNLHLLFSPVVDMRKYQTLQVQYKLSSNNSYITSDGKDVTFTFCDPNFHSEETGITLQQNVNKHLTVSSSWQTLTLDIRPMTRLQANEIDIWLDYLHFPTTYNFTLQIQSIKLVGATPSFDGAAISAATAPSNKTVADTVTTSDNLALKMTSAGAVVGLSKAPAGGGTAVDWSNSAQAGGFLVRDTTTTSAPTQLTGTVSAITGGYSVAANSTALHLNTTCSYTTSGNMIHVSMSATNTASTSRFLTYYFALPVKWGSWTWQADLLRSVAVGAPSTVNSAGPFYEEYTKQYPVAALNNATSNFGVALAVPLDQPRNYRIEYNEQTGVFYVAFDIGLSNIAASAGGNLNTATADVYLYAADPAWGFRSALQTFYNNFPQWFVQHTTGGGWQVSDGVSEPGLRFDWGQAPDGVWTANSQAGVVNTVYLMPSAPNFSLTALAPSDAAALSLIQGLASYPSSAATTQWNAIENEAYTLGETDVPYAEQNGLEAYNVTQAKAANASEVVDVNGNGLFGINYNPYMAESGQGQGAGTTPPLNLDPLIPNGGGQMNNAFLQSYLAVYTSATGVAPGGYAFDEYICDETCDYNTANFTYSPFPLTFERDVQKLSVPVRLTMAAWVKNLTQQSWSSGKILFGNLQGNFTFSAPYLDVFGAEGSTVSEPGYNRALAYNRAVTYLPYAEPYTNETQNEQYDYYNLLYGIYPGEGLEDAHYQAMVPVLDSITQVGWQPITYVTSSHANIRIERYGSGNPFYVVCYNLNGSSDTFSLALNTTGIGRTPVQATEIFGPNQGSVITPSGGTYTVTLGANQTCVLAMQTVVNGGVDFVVTPVAGDADIIPSATGQTVVGAYVVGSTAATVNGVAFTPIVGNGVFGGGKITLSNVASTTASVSSPTTAPFSGLSSSYKTLLGTETWSSTTAGLSVTLNQLTVGQQYTVRFWCECANNSWGNYTIVTSGGGTAGNAYWNYDYSVLDNSAAGNSGMGEYVTATFVANTASQTFTLTGGGSNGYPILNAIEVVQAQLGFAVQPIAGDTDVLATGGSQTVVGAYVVGGSGATVNGVAFTAVSGNGSYGGGNFTLGNVGSWAAGVGSPTSAPFANLSTAYKALLGNAMWSSTTSGLTLAFNNLTVGQQYTVRIWCEDADSSWGNYTLLASGGLTSGGAYWNYTYFKAQPGDSSAAESGLGEYLTATFVAGATSQTFTVTGGGSNGYPVLNAVELLKQ